MVDNEKYIITGLSLLLFVLVVGVLQANCQDVYEVDDEYAQANVIFESPLNDGIYAQSHTIHQVDDVDWVSFYALARTSYSLKTYNLVAGMDPYIHLFDANGQEVAPLWNSTNKPDEEEVLVFDCTVSGIYYAKIGHMFSVSYTSGAAYKLVLYQSYLVETPKALFGTITNNFNKVVPEAVILVTGSRGNGAGLSNWSGLFVATALEDNSYTVSVSAPGHVSWSKSGVAIPGKLDVVLTRFNTAPMAGSDKFLVRRGEAVTGNVLVNDSDGENDTLFAVLDSNVSHGTLQLNSNGSFTYTHDGQGGEDSFTYHATDTVANSSTVTVSLTFQQSMPFLMLLLNQP